MRNTLRFVAGFLLAILLAASVLSAGGAGYALLKEAVQSRGDSERFEAGLRHYTDRLVSTSNGNWELIQSPHPVLEIGAFLIDALVVAAVCGTLLRRIFPTRRPSAA